MISPRRRQLAIIILAACLSACGKPTPAAPVMSTSITKLQSQLSINLEIESCTWCIFPGQPQGSALVPSPGEAVLLCQIKLSPPAALELQKSGDWIAPAGPIPADVDRLFPGHLQHGLLASESYASRLITNTTWMRATVYYDPTCGVLFVRATKS